MTDEYSRSLEVERASGAGIGSAITGCLSATAAFVGVAVVLTIIGYVYGALFNVRPEFPVILTLTFILGMFAIMVASALAAVILGKGVFSRFDPWTGIAIGAASGALLIVAVWLFTTGQDADLFDWPELLYLLQLTVAGMVAGVTFFASTGRFMPITAGKAILAASIMVLLVMLVPFLLLWQARRSFEEEAGLLVTQNLRLSDDFRMAVTDESSGFGSLEKNIRYRASASLEDSEKSFSVVVIGQRRNFQVDIGEFYASLKVAGSETPVLSVWDDSEEGRKTQKAMLDLASSYVNTPLKIVSIRDTASSGKYIMMQGDGVEVVARPGGASSEVPIIDFRFSINTSSD